jgi:uncharacterized SAM-binding protein YcdF (DUF218 family)
MLRDLLPLELASAWVPVAAVGALVGPTRLHRVTLLLTAVLAVVWGIVGFTPVVGHLTRFVERREAPAPADAVLVLQHRLQLDGEPTAPTQARLLHGVELVVQGFASRLVLTDDPPGPTPASVARDQLRRLGLTQVEVVSLFSPPSAVRSTHAEAVRAGALCRERGWHRLLVVTSPLHARRACAAIEAEGLAVTCSPAIETEFDVEILDRPVDRFTAFARIVHEAVGLFVYQRRGWLTPP